MSNILFDESIDIVDRLKVAAAEINNMGKVTLGIDSKIAKLLKEAAKTIQQFRTFFDQSIAWQDGANPFIERNPAIAMILLEIVNERARQDKKWGGPESDDLRKTEQDWIMDISAYTAWALQMSRMGSPDKYRHRMKQIAALATAACESFDRKAGK